MQIRVFSVSTGIVQKDRMKTKKTKQPNPWDKDEKISDM